MKKILQFLFPIPSLSIMVFTFVIFSLSGGFKTAVEAFIAFFVIVILPLDVVIFAVKYFIQRRRDSEYEEAEEDVEEDGNIEEASVEPLNPIDDFAAQCVAECEFDPEQNNKTPGLDGNFRFDDKRFDAFADDEETKQSVSQDQLHLIADAITNVYSNFGMKTIIKGFNFPKPYVVVQIVPGAGVRVRDVLSLEDNLSMALGIPVIMNAMYNKGFIGAMFKVEDVINFKSKYAR